MTLDCKASKKMPIKNTLILIFFVLINISLYSQTNNDFVYNKDNLANAYRFYKAKNYSKAAELFEYEIENSPILKIEYFENLANAYMYFIDVGQGDSIFIQLPNNETMLIDAGEAYKSDNVINYLNNSGIKKIDYVVGTHPHTDHIGGLENIVNTFDIGSIYMPRATSTSKTYEDLQNTAQTIRELVDRLSVEEDSFFNKFNSTIYAIRPTLRYLLEVLGGKQYELFASNREAIKQYLTDIGFAIEEDFPFSDIICTKIDGSYKCILTLKNELFDAEDKLIDIRGRQNLEQCISMRNELIQSNVDDLPF